MKNIINYFKKGKKGAKKERKGINSHSACLVVQALDTEIAKYEDAINEQKGRVAKAERSEYSQPYINEYMFKTGKELIGSYSRRVEELKTIKEQIVLGEVKF